MIHYFRLGYLGSLYYNGHLRNVAEITGSGDDKLAAILYFDYLRRVNPKDYETWEYLANAYISVNDPHKARMILLKGLKEIPKNSIGYQKLLSLADDIKMN